MAIDVKGQLDQLFLASDEACERYGKLLPKTDDASLIVLKGHLIIEEMLYAVAEEHCQDRASLAKARLSFAQLRYVAQAMVKVPPRTSCWEAVGLLNSIRNSLVHNLEPKELEKQIHALHELCQLKDEPYPPKYVKPTELPRIAEACVSFIMGQLSVIHPVSAFIERNLTLPKE